MLARRQIRTAAVSALEALRGVTLSSPGDWESAPGKLPEVKVRVSDERKTAWTKTAPEFTTTVTLELLARVDGTTAEAAQDELEALGTAIESALFGNVAFVALCQQFSTVATQSAISAEGDRHVGGLQMRVDCETVEVFDPSTINASSYLPLTTVGVHVDSINVFDPTATYAAPPFPASVTPAPRTAGPDGRDEGGLLINLPQ